MASTALHCVSFRFLFQRLFTVRVLGLGWDKYGNLWDGGNLNHWCLRLSAKAISFPAFGSLISTLSFRAHCECSQDKL